jgi:chemotaxis family two-component system sensor kinase Cph1
MDATLTSCDREPIHIPGSIQPYGILLVTRRDDLLVRHVAGDVETRLGVIDWVDAPLARLIGDDLASRLQAEQEHRGGYLGRLTTASGEVLDASSYVSGPDLLIELEPTASIDASVPLVLGRLESIALAFERTTTLQRLCDRAALAFRELTSFDRVMIYQFLDDGAGRVLAEARRPDLHAFLHHHFPASDIPRQARALYLRNLTRVIPNATYQPAPLRPEWPALQPLDMSDSSLRSVSPIHLEYLRNMGVAASASISIVRDGALWGLVACHNETPRLMPYDVRVACRVLAGTLSRQIKGKEEAEGYRQRIRLRSFEDDIIELLSREGTLDDALSNHLDDVRRMLDSDGVAVLRGQELIMGGIHPEPGALRAMAQWALAEIEETVYATDRLEEAYAPAAKLHATASGVLALTLSADEPWIVLWLRVEQIEIVNWAGNPHKEANTGPDGQLTPRGSFEAWQETVRGRSRRWTLPELEAAGRLRRALLDVQQNRRLRDLNRQLTDILRDKDQLLEQKGFLIGEVNHRVQNSLQLVSSFLALQGRVTESEELRASLGEARRRISAVALVHRRLYRGDQLQVIDAARYIEELCSDTIISMGEEWAQHLSLNVAPVMIPTDRAVTVGLVLTELLININKYAYAGKPGPIEIHLTEERANLQLIVADRGGGKVSPRKGFGSRMMEGLVSQLGGALSYADNNPGLRAALVAPIAATP